MKKLIPIVLCFAGVASACAARPTTDSALAAKKEECFRQHHQLMDKPALRNERACWMAHAYLMER